VIALNIVAFGLFGVYRGSWQYAGIFDVYRVVGAILMGSAALFLYAEWRVPAVAQAHGIVYIDTVLAMALVLASRLSFKSLELVRERFRCRGARVLIYGADDGGELTLRELRNHAELGLRPVCFIDDDARRHGAEIHGVPIVAGFDGLAWVVHRHKIDKIVIGTRHLAPQAVALIQALAGSSGSRSPKSVSKSDGLAPRSRPSSLLWWPSRAWGRRRGGTAMSGRWSRQQQAWGVGRTGTGTAP